MLRNCTDVHEIERRLQEEPTLLMVDEDMSLLHETVGNSEFENKVLIQYLVTHHPGLLHFDMACGKTVLHIAASCGFLWTFKFLLPHCTGMLHQIDQYCLNALHWAVCCSNWHLVPLLLGHEIKSKLPPMLLQSTFWKHENTLLHVAAEPGCSVKIFRFVLSLTKKSALSPYTTNKLSETLLHTVAKNQSPDAVVKLSMILDKWPNLTNARNSNGFTALHVAIEYKNFAVAKRLAEANPSTITIQGRDSFFCSRSPWIWAARNANEDMIDFFSRVMPDVHRTKTMSDETCLHFTSSIALARRCILHDPTMIDAVDCKGDTPLHAAVRHQHSNIAAFLVSLKPSLVFQKNQRDETALEQMYHADAAKNAVRNEYTKHLLNDYLLNDLAKEVCQFLYP